MRIIPLQNIILLFILAALAGCKGKKDGAAPSGSPRNAAPARVDAFIVKTESLNEDIESSGTLLPAEETELRPEVSGRVVKLNVKEGSFVSKGDLLVKLFDGDLQAQLRKLNIQLQIAKKTVERQGELLKISGISQQEYDLSGLQVNNIRADMELIRTSIAKTEIRAPYNGRLGFRMISPGAYITPQTIVATIRQLNQLKLEFTVPEKYGARIRSGMNVTFSVEGSPNRFSAVVSATESGVNPADRSLKIRAMTQATQNQLVAGSFARVFMHLGESADALMIPSQAVVPQARNKKVAVYRSGAARFETVTTGQRDSARVQVLTGLKAGDTIIVTGLMSLKPDAKVTLGKVE